MTPEEVTPHTLFKAGMQYLARDDVAAAAEQLSFAQALLDLHDQQPYGELEIYLGLCWQRLGHEPEEAAACLERAMEMLGEERYSSIIAQWNKPTWKDRIFRILTMIGYGNPFFPFHIPDEPPHSD